MSEQSKIEVLRQTIDERLKELYVSHQTEFCKEAKMLEYLMCIIEADEESLDYAKACLIKMYE